ncbi:RidA family protein [Jonesia quinghaiensis]|uniref:RidA family protein n=1 Tax=Jonesia quinghaiensis TaxID=262806 RepID=UPI000408837A|nr:RidA family protein [Jonesia quinghaiensis]
MAVHLLSPTGLATPVPYHHVSVATGTKTISVAGQTGGSIGNRTPEPGDLATQVAEALRNVAIALAGAGATFADTTRLTFYVTAWEQSKMSEFLEGIEAVRNELKIPDLLPPASLIGVQILFEPGVLVEIEATAVVN